MIEAPQKGHAILVVDPQPDFFEGGTLPITGATRTAERIAEFLRYRGDEFSMKIVTQDWHLDPGEHWSDDPNYVTTWPVHCAADTNGADIHASLVDARWDVVIRKGLLDGAYSAFEGRSEDETALADVLSSAGITSVTIVGFATDHCVRATALDARSLGLHVRVLLDLCAGVTPDSTRSAIVEMTRAGVTMMASEDA